MLTPAKSPGAAADAERRRLNGGSTTSEARAGPGDNDELTTGDAEGDAAEEEDENEEEEEEDDVDVWGLITSKYSSNNELILVTIPDFCNGASIPSYHSRSLSFPGTRCDCG